VVEYIADHLHLWEDQTAFGRFDVNGGDQQHHIAVFDEVAYDGLVRSADSGISRLIRSTSSST
jgi:hypothetical protein